VFAEMCKTNKLWDLKNGITQKMKNENIDREIRRFYYIKHNNVLLGKERLENILETLI